MDKEKKIKILNDITEITDSIIYVICCGFMLTLIFCALVFLLFVLKQDAIYGYYLCGLICVLSVVGSINFISNYHKKYFKNDSDSSKRQNYFLFEEDIRRGEERYDNRRELVQ